MKKESVIRYEQMEASPDGFPNYLRVNLEWDESKYQEMIQIVKTVLDDFSESDLFPKSVHYFFTAEIDHIIGTVSNKLFLRSTPKNLTKEEFISFIDKRKNELVELKEEFFYGKI